ncbi:MAG: glycosyl transferase [Lachnospiraceae bacterium]|nr:glycosyl transferase [Lachnospiraceae bacterium]
MKGIDNMKFGMKQVTKKRLALNSNTKKITSKSLVWLFKGVLVLIVVAVITVGFAGFGMIKGIIETAPEVDDISITPSGYYTVVYDNNGKQITKLLKSGSNRESVTIDQIPEHLQYAFIDIEDERFYEHDGIDIKGIIRAGFVAIKTRSLSQGASTITQQLLKNNVFENGGRESSTGALIRRKIQEQYLALKLEKSFDKEIILENYLNTINLGSDTLGVQAAAKRYFNKGVSKLTISESAVLAAITQNPTEFNPVINPENNARRREKVLRNMLNNGHITKEEFDEAINDDVYARIKSTNVKTSKSNPYSYFVDALIDQVMEDLQEQKGYTETQAYNALFSGGLSIYTTQDTEIQKICDEEINNPDNYPTKTYYSITWNYSVEHADGTVDNYSEVNIDYFNRVTLDNPNFEMLFETTEEADEYVKAFKEEFIKEDDEVLGENIQYTLQPQASFTVMDQYTGEVKAIVGGRGKKSASRTFNRAVSSPRQPGSCFKVLSTYAPAIDNAGYTLASTIDDAPFADVNGRLVNNWYEGYRGMSTLRDGIRDSMNVITVKLLTEITPQLGFDYLMNFGFTTLVENQETEYGVYTDINQSLALGGITYGVTNLELCAAYATIANAGVYNSPILYTKVLDHDGNIILESKSESHTVLKETTAWLLTDAMRDVVTSGTGGLANVPNMYVAGKTGTTTDDNDIWFSGYTPYLTATIWSGFDDNGRLSDTSYHNRLWSKIVTRIDEAKGYTYKEFEKPDSIEREMVCSISGMLPAKGICSKDPAGNQVHYEYFVKNTVPTDECNLHTKLNICNKSHKIANKDCTKTTTQIFRLRPEGSDLSVDTWDTPYVAPPSLLKSKCRLH